MQNTKRWYQSKIIWVQIIAVILDILQFLSSNNYLPPATITIIVAIVTIIFRAVSNAKITTGKNDNGNK